MLILTDECWLLQSLPYGKKIVDVVADDKHFFIGDEGFKVIIMEKGTNVIVDKIDCSSYVVALTRTGENHIRVCGENDTSFFINMKTFQTDRHNEKIYCW